MRQEIVMSFRKVAFAAAAIAIASIASAEAGGPSAHKIDLGTVNGVAYYTEEAGRFHVVATLAQQDGQPVRFETVLLPGQTIVLSTANEGGSAPTSVEISRQADDLLVHTVAVTN
jgi:hypothetical protein